MNVYPIDIIYDKLIIYLLARSIYFKNHINTYSSYGYGLYTHTKRVHALNAGSLNIYMISLKINYELEINESQLR